MSNKEIKKICEKYGIENYTIKDGLVNVDGDVNLENKVLTELPLKFGEVSGDFICYYNKLTSLEGSPTYVGGYFDCSCNNLTDLTVCPDEVGGFFRCNFNEIYSLDGLLFKRIDNITIGNNPIFNLYRKYQLDDIYHREFLIEADVIRQPKVKGGKPIINKVRMDWFTQTYGLEEFKGDENYSIED